jgi:spore coat polysaccharide biosynthesis protein SpsF
LKNPKEAALTLNIAAIIQARMTSTRLPGKVLLEVAGRPMLVQQIRRLESSQRINEIVIATTTNETDNPIAELAQRAGVRCFRGSENDVLSRFAGAAREIKADLVVRLTADCPLIDAEVTDAVIFALLEHTGQYDYASNVLQRTYPRGLDVEAMFGDVLYRMDRLADSRQDREHVTTFLRSSHPELFLTCSVEDSQNNADLRWTVDTQKDFELICKIYAGMYLGETPASYREILAFVRNQPEISQLNSEVTTWEPTQDKP